MPPVNSTKSLLGHTLGASGAIEALVTALTLRDGVAHPSRNLSDPEIPLDVVEVDFRPDPARSTIEIEARTVTSAKTGVEMEAMVAVSVAALAIYDMAKAIVDNLDKLPEMNPLFRGLNNLFEPLRTEGAAAFEFGGVALHGGAIKAYRETGWLK